MTIKFQDAKREGTHLLIGLAGPSGSGKTLSALRIARGLVGGNGGTFVIDTEAGRALHYACADGEDSDKFRFKFKHADLVAPFSPMAYADALQVAVKAGAKVIIVDSASHEHEGPGGILEMHAKEHERMGNREATKFAAWIKPKAAHNLYVNTLLQLKAHLIFCFRAKDKMKMVKNDKGKMEPVSMGWTAICPDRMEYEMADLLLLPPGAQGVPDLSLGKVYEQHKAYFPTGKPIDEEVGRKLAEWAEGGAEREPGVDPEELDESEMEQFEAGIALSANMEELDRVALQIRERGVSGAQHESLMASWKDRRAELK